MTWMGAVGGRPTGSASRGIVSKRTCREQSYGMGIGEVLSNLGRSVACLLMTQCEWGTDAGGGTGSLLLVLGQGAAGWQGQGTALGGQLVLVFRKPSPAERWAKGFEHFWKYWPISIWKVVNIIKKQDYKFKSQWNTINTPIRMAEIFFKHWYQALRIWGS